MKSEILAQGMTAADLDKLDLIADVQFFEPMGSAALNRKFYGIMPPGIYRGFQAVVRGGLKVSVGDSPVNVAAVDVDGFMITVQGRRPVELTVPVGRKVYGIIEANYAVGRKTTQVDINASIKAADIRIINPEEKRSNHVVIFSANLPAGTTEIRADQIDLTERQEADIGSDAIDRHTKNYLNPHQVNKGQIGLSDVENYGVATVEEAQAGTATHKYMTPALTKTAIESISSPVPLPDVWIPFNDSLRMITGFGDYDRVYIGEQYLELNSRSASFERATTATYIDKSGVLRTAAINEPRFEKQGLLIEGQSANLLGYTENVVCGGANTNNGLIDEVTPFGTVGKVAESKYKAATHTPYSDYPLFNKTYEAGVKVSTSIFVKPVKSDGMKAIAFETYYAAGGANGVDCIFSLDSRTVTNTKGDGKVSCDILANGWVRLKMTYTTTAETKTLLRVRYLTATGNDAFSDQVLYSFGAQLEELPFASSYIPTNGTAVTRAADICSIQSLGNKGGYANDVTYAAEFNEIGRSTTAYFFGFVDGGYPTRKHIARWNDGQILASNDYVKARTTANQSNLKGTYVAAFDYDGGKVTLKTPDGLYKSTTECVNKDGQEEVALLSLYFISAGRLSHVGFGHIRNFRIWHRALSDAQIKGLA